MLLGFLSILDRLSIRRNAEKSSEEIFSKGMRGAWLRSKEMEEIIMTRKAAASAYAKEHGFQVVGAEEKIA